MGEIIYNGKVYFEPEYETQQALLSVGIHSFRYHVKEALMICSDYFVRTFGCPKYIENMPQGIADYLIDERDWGDLQEMYRRIQAGSTRVSTNLRTKSGVMSRVTCITMSRDEKGLPDLVVGIVEDLGEEIRVSGILQALSQDFHSIYYVDFDNNVIYPHRLSEVIEEQYGSFFRSRPSYEMAISAYIANTVVKEERQDVLASVAVKNLETKFTEHNNTYTLDYRAEHDGKITYCRMKAVNISEEPGLHRMVLGFADVSSDKKREIERLAYVDPVTGSDNYNAMKEKLQLHTQPGYLLAMDLYAFKAVNVTCGTARGDEALRRVHGCIREYLKPNDLAGHMNADHFVIFLDTTNPEYVLHFATHVNDAIIEASHEMGIPKLIPYFGAAIWNPGQTVELTFGEANIAKHENKEIKNQLVSFYTQESSERMLVMKQMEDSFEPALQNGEFEIWLQGKFSPVTKELRGAEALVRWRTQDGMLVPPGAFIPLFEKNGMIRKLDEYVFRHVCEMQKHRLDSGRDVVPISVNLSRITLYYGDLTRRYKEIAESVGISTELVPIEITESAMVENREVERIAREFREAGFRLHMDDFGSGYSSLSALNVVRFDTMKLDKSLIDFIGDPGGNKLLQHMISLGKDIGMEIVAEGVETEEQVEFLREQNCDMIQGFYYSKPLSIEEFIERYEY